MQEGLEYGMAWLQQRRRSVAVAVAAIAWALPAAAEAAEVVLRLRAGADFEIGGDLRAFEAGSYIVDTRAFGRLTLDATLYDCAGPGCAQAATTTAEPPRVASLQLEPAATGAGRDFTIESADGIALTLMPALVRGYAEHANASSKQLLGSDARQMRFKLTGGPAGSGASIDVKRSDSTAAIAALASGTAAIALTARPIADAEQAALLRAVPQLRGTTYEHVIGLDGLVVIVASESPATKLNVSDLVRIFKGQATDWSQLGLPAGPIHLYASTEKGGSADRLAQIVLDQPGLPLPPGTKLLPDEVQLSDAVARDPLGIAVTSLAYVRSARGLDITNACGLAWRPTPFAVKSEEYPLSRRRPEHSAGPSLRFASVDIGGGATSLAITTFVVGDNGGVTGIIDVRDGARIGSDDVAKAIVERYVLPALAQSLEQCRLSGAGDFLAEILGGRSKGRPSWLGGFGRRFARDFALPVAVALVKAHADTPDLASEVAARHTIGSLLERSNVAARAVAEELDDLATDEGAAGFACLSVPVTFLKDDMTATIMSVVGPLLGNVVRLVDGLDCDTVLLSGSMAQLPVVLDTLLEAMPGRAGHIVQLGSCVVGDWLPWRTASGKIGDTKPLAALGALIATAGESRGGFAPSIRTRDESEPALLVGRMDANGMIADDAVQFTLGASLGRGGDTDKGDRAATLVVDPPTVLGARRLPLATWPAMPCYVLDVEAPLPKGRYRLPLRVTIEPRRATDSAREELFLVKAMDVEGVILSERELSLRFQTLPQAKGYWLDSGVLMLDPGERRE